jgi:hypothetical protein
VEGVNPKKQIVQSVSPRAGFDCANGRRAWGFLNQGVPRGVGIGGNQEHRMRISFRMVAFVARASHFEEAQRPLSQLRRCPDFRHEKYRESPRFPTIALSPTGSSPQTHVACLRPYPAEWLDGLSVPGVRVAYLDGLALGDEALLVIGSYSQFHWVIGAEDLDSKVAEHSAHVFDRVGLRPVSPEPDDIPQFAPLDVEPSQPTPLSTGHVVRVARHGTRAGYPAHTLHVVEFWQGSVALDGGAPPLHVQDFETQWNGPHANPGARMQRILERYVQTNDLSKPAGLLAEQHWSDETDTHGNLGHPTMQRFKAVQ